MKSATTESDEDQVRLTSKDAIMQAITNGMDMLGPSGTVAAFFHIEQRFGLKQMDIPFRPGEFTHAVRSIFGVGSGVLLGSILNQLKSVNGASDKLRTGFEKNLVIACTEIEKGIM